MPWFRISNVSRDLDNNSKITDLTRFGLTWWPTSQITFKVDIIKYYFYISLAIFLVLVKNSIDQFANPINTYNSHLIPLAHRAFLTQ